MSTKEKQIYTLISLEEFKAVLCVDDREDKLARFYLVLFKCLAYHTHIAQLFLPAYLHHYSSS